MPIKHLTLKNIENFNPNKDKMSLVFRVIETCKKWTLNLRVNTIPNISPIPPWSDILQNIESNFMENMNKNTPHQMIQQHFHLLENTTYQNYDKIYSDGSKIKEPKSTAAIYIQNKNITIQWIPAHKSITGNEIADLAAKKAHELENSITITQDTNNIIKDIKDKIKRQWEEQIQRTLITKTYYLKDNTPQPWSRSENRKLDVCLTRILTKHTRLKKHLHRLNLETDPNCRWCQFPEETIEHLTLQCPRFH
ncbi:uncharacterized protein LOC119575191, partial [Penaeus monodon]|uniref:uncharacterized protein LOC119575191 n=1 Tax=Penaeus monodon TaxID=6687 RepID=UPI0018A76B55